eukprot:12113865-Alexandrium_andersonii.AAC.1
MGLHAVSLLVVAQRSNNIFVILSPDGSAFVNLFRRAELERAVRDDHEREALPQVGARQSKRVMRGDPGPED